MHSTTFKQSLVIAFCVWHMTAIAAYALPDTLKDVPVFKQFRNFVYPKTKAYVQITSQWQKWPLFAPDPLRRVIEFVVVAKVDGMWVETKRIASDTVPWWKHSSELKTIRRLEKKDHYGPLREAYVHEVCRTQRLPAGTPMQLRVDWYVIPRNAKPQSAAWWREWEPEWSSRVEEETVCS